MSDTPYFRLRQEAITARMQGDLAGAEAKLNACLAIRDDETPLFAERASVRLALGQEDAARTDLQIVLGREGNDFNALSGMSHALSLLDRPDLAFPLLEELIAQNPNETGLYLNATSCLRRMNRFEDAIELAHRGLKTNPDTAELYMLLAVAHLSLGQFDEARNFYQSRFHFLGTPKLSEPRWFQQELTGQRVVIIPEQGYGDILLCARYLPRAVSLGAELHLLCHRPMFRLMRNQKGMDDISVFGEPREPADYWITTMDLLTYYQHNDTPIPPPRRFDLPSDSVARAKKLVASYQNDFKIGFCWTGSEQFKNNRMRSCPVEKFLELTDWSGIKLFNLFKGRDETSLMADPRSAHVINAAATDRDIADAAALMDELDLVITVDTMIAHLAGTQGVPVWNLLHYDPYWYYHDAEQTSQWYPTMRLFRQSQSRHWDEVFEAVYAALRKELA